MDLGIDNQEKRLLEDEKAALGGEEVDKSLEEARELQGLMSLRGSDDLIASRLREQQQVRAGERWYQRVRGVEGGTEGDGIERNASSCACAHINIHLQRQFMLQQNLDKQLSRLDDLTATSSARAGGVVGAARGGVDGNLEATLSRLNNLAPFTTAGRSASARSSPVRFVGSLLPACQQSM